jgi:hypothetical protein
MGEALSEFSLEPMKPKPTTSEKAHIQPMYATKANTGTRP